MSAPSRPVAAGTLFFLAAAAYAALVLLLAVAACAWSAAFGLLLVRLASLGPRRAVNSQAR
jgi:hypothetical protein